jgi:ATP phosphoribosyltransferase
LEIIGEPLLYSEAVVIEREGAEALEAMDLLLKRLNGILVAREYVLLEYVAPRSRLEEACKLTPGVKSPTLSPVSEADWMAVSAMVRVKGLNRIIDALSQLGAKGIIAHDIRTCRL